MSQFNSIILIEQWRENAFVKWEIVPFVSPLRCAFVDFLASSLPWGTRIRKHPNTIQSFWQNNGASRSCLLLCLVTSSFPHQTPGLPHHGSCPNTGAGAGAGTGSAAASGGTASGGTASGGTASGGTASGGTASGGTASGGTASGAASDAAGTSAGGASAGGAVATSAALPASPAPFFGGQSCETQEFWTWDRNSILMYIMWYEYLWIIKFGLYVQAVFVDLFEAGGPLPSAGSLATSAAAISTSPAVPFSLGASGRSDGGAASGRSLVAMGLMENLHRNVFLTWLGTKMMRNNYPIGSMVLVYMLTFGVYWWDPCYHI